jgi:hypothetical protein
MAKKLGLIYFDVHPDLNVLASVSERVLGWRFSL